MSKKLAVFFPGIGYTVDKPLMYYSRKIAASAGYEIKLLPYTGFPEKILGDTNRMQESYAIALRQSEEMLAEFNLREYDDLLFVGKSIGTIVAAELASRTLSSSCPDTGRTNHSRIRFVLYTPLDATFRFPIGEALVFTGSEDPWVGREKSRISSLCNEADIPCIVIAGGNHSLETGDLQKDISNLQMIMQRTGEFIGFI